MRVAFIPLIAIAFLASTAQGKVLSCDEIWTYKDNVEFCCIYALSDASAGTVLLIDEKGHLSIPLPRRYELDDPKTGKKRIFKTDAVGAYDPFDTRFRLKDGRVIESYTYNENDGTWVYFLKDDPYSENDIPDPLPDGEYELENGRKFTVKDRQPIFEDWTDVGLPPYLYPPVEFK